MSNSKTDKIRERLEDYAATQNGHDAAFVSGKLANTLEAVVEKCESSRYPVDRQSSLIARLLNLIADELDVEEG